MWCSGGDIVCGVVEVMCHNPPPFSPLSLLSPFLGVHSPCWAYCSSWRKGSCLTFPAPRRIGLSQVSQAGEGM